MEQHNISCHEIWGKFLDSDCIENDVAYAGFNILKVKQHNKEQFCQKYSIQITFSR